MSAESVQISDRHTVARRLAIAFKRHGVEVAFGQSIPSLFFLAAASVGIRQASYRAENAGGAMADGYARVSGKVAVVAAQNGPAATLLVAPLAEALKASIPIVALVQDVPRQAVDRNAFQELDHLRLFDACAKWVRRLERPERVEDMVDMAFNVAASGRPGPAVLLVPYDLLAEVGEVASTTSRRRDCLGRYPLDRPVADPSRVKEAAALIAAARQPLIVAGGGIHVSGAAAELAALQQAWHLPVATTAMGKGSVDETHPLSLGVAGYFMGRGSRTHELRSMFDRADLILLVGTRTNQNGTDSWQLYPRGARYVHIDAAPEEVGRNYEALRLVGDAKSTLAALREVLDSSHPQQVRSHARASIEQEISTAVSGWRDLIGRTFSARSDPIRPEHVMAELDALLTPDAIVAADASYASIWTANYLTARRAGQRFISPRGLAGLGWGLPYAIGAQLAEPDSPVVCVVGDGGFAHAWAELETLARLRLPIIVLVLNNQILGYQKHAETVLFGEFTDACDFKPVDHAAIARACGVRGMRIEHAREVAAALADAFARREPVVIDLMIDADAYPPITLFESTAESSRLPSPF